MGSSHPTSKCTSGSFSLPGTKHKCWPTGSPYPTDESTSECTIGSFPLPNAKHKRQPTGSLHPIGKCIPCSFPLPGAKHKHQPTGRWIFNQIVTLLWVSPPLIVDAFNLSMCRTHILGSYQVHSSVNGAKSLLESNRESNSTARISLLEGQLYC